MKKNSLRMDTSIKSKPYILFVSLPGLLIAVVLQLLFINGTYAEITLTPYSAIYSTTFSGLSAQLKHSLKNIDNNLWSLSNKTSIIFSDFEEEASFVFQGDKLQPINYRYENPFNSKRNSKLYFNWEKNTVTEKARPTPTLDLPIGTLDNLTFQLQLRLDLLTQADSFTQMTYKLVDRHRLKTYTITYLGDDTITTPAGKFSAIKIKQQRPGKEKYTIIWLAKNWDYFIVQIERFEKGQSRYKLELESASIAGSKMVAGAPTTPIKTLPSRPTGSIIKSN